MATPLETKARNAAEQLDAHVREIIAWHFNPETGCEFWLNWAKERNIDPRKEVHNFADLKKLGHFEDEWLRGGPVRRWLPRGLAGKPIYIFETGGSTGVPKSRLQVNDFRIDYENFSATLSDANVAALKETLRAASGGKDVRLTAKVDPTIIGGLVVKIGSRMVDGSLRTKLNAIRIAMKEVG